MAPPRLVLPPLKILNNNVSDDDAAIAETVFALLPALYQDSTDPSWAASDGEHLCALLPLEPMNHSVYWDTQSCRLTEDKESAAVALFRCRCSQGGTIMLLRAVRLSQVICYILLYRPFHQSLELTIFR